MELTETVDAFDAVRGALVAQLVGLTPTDTATMQACVCAVQSLDAVRRVLMQVVDTGMMEEAAEMLKASFKPA